MNSSAVETVLQNSIHSGTKLLLMIAIAKHINYNSGSAYPSNETLAKLCRVSTKTIKRLIPELVDSGEISVVGGYGTGQRREFFVNLVKVEIILPMSAFDGENVQNSNQKADISNGKADIVMSINGRMSALEKEISDIKELILDIHEKKADISNQKADIGAEIVDIAMSHEERSIRSNKKKEEDRTRMSPKNYQNFDSLHEVKSPIVIKLEAVIKKLVRNSTSSQQINDCAMIAIGNDISAEDLELDFSGKDSYWFVMGYGKKDGQKPWVQNIINEMVNAKDWRLSKKKNKVGSRSSSNQHPIMQSGAY